MEQYFVLFLDIYKQHNHFFTQKTTSPLAWGIIEPLFIALLKKEIVFLCRNRTQFTGSRAEITTIICILAILMHCLFLAKLGYSEPIEIGFIAEKCA